MGIGLRHRDGPARNRFAERLAHDALVVSPLRAREVGSDNDRELVEMVLPGTQKPFPHENLRAQKTRFVDAGFKIPQEDEAYRPIYFYDTGAFVRFARIIEWEFPGFSVDRCFDRLLQLQRTIERDSCSA